MFRGHRNRDVCVLLDYVLSAERDDISKVEGSRLIVVMLKRGDPVTPQPLSSCRGSFEVSYTSTRLLLFCFRDFLQKNSRNRKHWHLTEERELIAKASFVAELDTARSRNLPGFTSLALLSTTGSRLACWGPSICGVPQKSSARLYRRRWAYTWAGCGHCLPWLGGLHHMPTHTRQPAAKPTAALLTTTKARA